MSFHSSGVKKTPKLASTEKKVFVAARQLLRTRENDCSFDDDDGLIHPITLSVC